MQIDDDFRNNVKAIAKKSESDYQKLVDNLESKGYCVKRFYGDSGAPAIENAIRQYKESGLDKKLIIFAFLDDEVAFNIDESHFNETNLCIFRSSAKRSLLKPYEHILPFMLANYPLCPPIEKDISPRISFCGWADSHPDRRVCVNTLLDGNSNGRIKTNFIIRHDFWGGSPNSLLMVQDFCSNMYMSEFNLCVRGNGNFACRFYQTLSCGRIPVLVDTDIELPFSDKINWKEICVISASVDRLVDDIILFWNNNDIFEVQKKCRIIHEKYLEGDNLNNAILSYINF